MSQITRTWLAFAALGAGLIHLALVISSPPPVAVALAVLGVAEVGWGILTFAKDDLLLPEVVRVVAVAPVIVWSLLVVASVLLDAPFLSSSLTLVPMAIALVFQFFVAAVITGHLRRLPDRPVSDPDVPAAPPRAPSAGRYLLALFAGALLVSGLTTPALAATKAGQYAQPHGEHQAGFVPKPPTDDPLAGLVLPDHGAH